MGGIDQLFRGLVLIISWLFISVGVLICGFDELVRTLDIIIETIVTLIC